jgi:hypothetical protein
VTTSCGSNKPRSGEDDSRLWPALTVVVVVVEPAVGRGADHLAVTRVLGARLPESELQP